MTSRFFAVIGAGSGGLAMAGHLALLGHGVALYNRSAERISEIEERGGVSLRGVVEGLGRIELASSNIAEVVSQADVIMIVVPAFAHRDVAELCAPHLRDGQAVLLTPGRTGGAIEFRRVLERAGTREKVQVAEAQTILHTCRVGSVPAEVTIFSVKQQVPVAALPARDTDDVLARIRETFSQFTRAESVLSTSLGNVGAILHPAPTLLNVGWIETMRTQFLHYYEGITPSVARLLEQMDSERLAIASAIGVSVPSVTEWLESVYGARGGSLFDTIQATDAYREVYAPQTIQHRYLYEDVPTGLVPMASLGDVVGVDTPRMDLVIELACGICGVDFWARGRTVEALGLSGLDAEGLRRFVGIRSP